MVMTSSGRLEVKLMSKIKNRHPVVGVPMLFFTAQCNWKNLIDVANVFN